MPERVHVVVVAVLLAAGMTVGCDEDAGGEESESRSAGTSASTSGGESNPDATRGSGASAQEGAEVPVPKLRDGIEAELGEIRHVIVTKTPSWEAPTGELTLYSRQNDGWKPVVGPIPANIGENGLGWGRGWTLPPETSSVPTKKEGDGKATAGIFPIGKAYGYEKTPPDDVTIPYEQVTKNSYCVYDSTSEHYNQVFDWPKGKEKEWTKAETMRRDDDLYSLLLSIRHNRLNGPPEKIEPGAGSCIFLHVWKGRGEPTVGCTSVAKEKLVAILRQLESPERTLFVQFPEEVYATLAKKLDLPS